MGSREKGEVGVVIRVSVALGQQPLPLSYLSLTRERESSPKTVASFPSCNCAAPTQNGSATAMTCGCPTATPTQTACHRFPGNRGRRPRTRLSSARTLPHLKQFANAFVKRILINIPDRSLNFLLRSIRRNDHDCPPSVLRFSTKGLLLPQKN